MNHPDTALLDAGQTASRLPWRAMVEGIGALLRDQSVEVPPRLVQALPGGGSLFVMPALDGTIAITKLITFTPANAGSALPAIQGDVVVFDIATGRRRLVLDGPTVTARRTAAVSAFAAQRLAPDTQGPLLVIGAGVQGKAHLEAFAEVLGVRQFVIASRSPASADALALHARTLGFQAQTARDANTALADCPMAVTCTPASEVILNALPRKDAFVCAVGAFTPGMVELAPDLCRHFAMEGNIFVDTADALHEAGDLLQAGLEVNSFATLADVVREDQKRPAGPVLFKAADGRAGIWLPRGLLAAANSCLMVQS